MNCQKLTQHQLLQSYQSFQNRVTLMECQGGIFSNYFYASSKKHVIRAFFFF